MATTPPVPAPGQDSPGLAMVGNERPKSETINPLYMHNRTPMVEGKPAGEEKASRSRSGVESDRGENAAAAASAADEDETRANSRGFDGIIGGGEGGKKRSFWGRQRFIRRGRSSWRDLKDKEVMARAEHLLTRPWIETYGCGGIFNVCLCLSLVAYLFFSTGMHSNGINNYAPVNMQRLTSLTAMCEVGYVSRILVFLSSLMITIACIYHLVHMTCLRARFTWGVVRFSPSPGDPSSMGSRTPTATSCNWRSYSSWLRWFDRNFNVGGKYFSYLESIYLVPFLTLQAYALNEHGANGMHVGALRIFSIAILARAVSVGLLVKFRCLSASNRTNQTTWRSKALLAYAYIDACFDFFFGIFAVSYGALALRNRSRGSVCLQTRTHWEPAMSNHLGQFVTMRGAIFGGDLFQVFAKMGAQQFPLAMIVSRLRFTHSMTIRQRILSIGPSPGQQAHGKRITTGYFAVLMVLAVLLFTMQNIGIAGGRAACGSSDAPGRIWEKQCVGYGSPSFIMRYIAGKECACVGAFFTTRICGENSTDPAMLDNRITDGDNTTAAYAMVNSYRLRAIATVHNPVVTLSGAQAVPNPPDSVLYLIMNHANLVTFSDAASRPVGDEDWRMRGMSRVLWIQLNHNPALRDLDGVERHVRALVFQATASNVTDITPLTKLTRLNSIVLRGASRLSHVPASLAELDQLKVLDLGGTNVSVENFGLKQDDMVKGFLLLIDGTPLCESRTSDSGSGAVTWRSRIGWGRCTPSCAPLCSPVNLGNGQCEAGCMNPECRWDALGPVEDDLFVEARRRDATEPDCTPTCEIDCRLKGEEDENNPDNAPRGF